MRIIHEEIDANAEPCELAPPEAFDDRVAPEGFAAKWNPDYVPGRVGPRSQAVRDVFVLRCCGYVRAPTELELYTAMRRSEPTRREEFVTMSWIMEANQHEYWWAWTEQAYSWRMFARALRRSGAPRYRVFRWLHMFATDEDLVPPNARPVWR